MAGAVPADDANDEQPDFGSLRSGARLGRYELLVPVARGGMARVWAARQHGQHGFQKIVAIKTILPALAAEAEFERMFLDEARIASAVHHPNVCEIYDLGEDAKTLYLAMEWVNGDSLARLAKPAGKADSLDPRIAARVIADACAGVHAAHEQTDDDGKPLNVVHRDLSPHNVLLTADGVSKVCDFGVAKALGQLHHQTSVGDIKGKIAYMSPEQITNGAVDRRSDVFSLGCVLYEVTTGSRPFKGADHQVMYAILHDELERPSTVIRSYPPELERIVLRALSNDPIHRFPTAERMRIALEEFLTKGQLVTQSNVAQVVRSRLGEELDRRRERIKQASSSKESVPTQEQRSGVKPTRTIQMGAVRPPMKSEPVEAPLPQLDGEDNHPEQDNPKTLLMVYPGPITTPQQAFPPAPRPAAGLPAHVPPPPTRRPYESAPPFEQRAYSLPPRAPVRRPEYEQGQAGQYALAALVGLVLAVLLGGGGFLIWRAHTMREARPAQEMNVAP